MPLLTSGRGWRPDLPGFIEKSTKFGLYHIGLGGYGASSDFAAPKSVDHLSSHAHFRNQGHLECCVGFGLGGASETRLRFLGYEPVPFSWFGIWTITRQLNRASLNEPLVDEGTYPFLAAFGLRSFGIPTEEQFPYDASPEGVAREIDFQGLANASSFRLQAFNRITESNEDALVDTLKVLLANGHPTTVGMRVGRRYMEWRAGDDPVGVEDGDPEGGGHYVYLTGYDDDGDTFRSVSSYGKGHGDNGIVLLSREKIVASSTSDFYNITIAESASP
jgi:hypothetical protein